MGLDEKDASYLLSIVGIANTIGRIVLGFLSDKEWVNRLYLYNIALATCGLSKILKYDGNHSNQIKNLLLLPKKVLV